MLSKREIEPIAVIKNDFCEKFGIPRQSGRVEIIPSRIIFEPKYRVADALREIEGFSHLWLIFDFSKAEGKDFSPTVRPPRLGGNRRVGVFASRSPFRPNRLGLSCVRLLGVEEHRDLGKTLLVGGADLLDGTPIYDIKPYLPFSDARPDAAFGYAEDALSHHLSLGGGGERLSCLGEKAEAVLACLSEDPRPSYQDDPRRIYSMRYGSFDIRFRVEGDLFYIEEVVGADAGCSN